MRCDGQLASEMKSYIEFDDGQSSCFQNQPDVVSIKDTFYSYMCVHACLCGSSRSIPYLYLHDRGGMYMQDSSAGVAGW